MASSRDDIRAELARRLLGGEAALTLHHQKMYDDLQRFYFEIVRMLAQAVDTKDSYTQDHSERARELARRVVPFSRLWVRLRGIRSEGPAYKHIVLAPQPGGKGTAGGAQMYAYDFNGDKRNDVFTTLNPHGAGLAWYEQLPGNGEAKFKPHVFMNKTPADNRYGVQFTQPHAIVLADMDGDGVQDSGERGLAGVTVTATAGVPSSSMTASELTANEGRTYALTRGRPAAMRISSTVSSSWT